MIIVMRTGAEQEEIDDVKKAVADEGLETYVMVGEERIVMGVVGVGVGHNGPIHGAPGVDVKITGPTVNSFGFKTQQWGGHATLRVGRRLLFE